MWPFKKKKLLSIAERAEIAAQLIESSWDTSYQFASTLEDTFRDNPGYHLRLGTAEASQMRIETAAILFRILDESAFGVLNAEERDKFMDELGASICSSVTATGEDASAFLSILNERLAEYAHYKKWIPEGEESAKGTLFWEFGKRVSPIVGLEKHAMFNLTLTNLLLKSIDRWNLRELLLGSWNPARE